MQGPPDGVEADVKCVFTEFTTYDGKKTIAGQNQMPCHIICAYSEGTIGFSMREIDMMLTVRIDDLFEILKAAGQAAQELKASMPKEYTDAELEKRWDELEDVPFDEADSPSGLILSDDWWIFPKGVDREDIWHYFDENHSRGIEYLIYGKEASQ